MEESIKFVEELKRKHALQASPYNAPIMEGYMKNQFAFYGIHSPERKEILKSQIKDMGYPSLATIDHVIRLLWDAPYRELQYSAQEILSRKQYLESPQRIELIEFMIVNKSWWDTVDFIACKLAGEWFRKHPDQIIPITGRWIESENMWLKRAAILFQLKYKNDTNEELLFDYIRRLSGEQDFFIRKAVGWALREYAKTNPLSVRMFVSDEQLSSLSTREALKHFSPMRKDEL